MPEISRPDGAVIHYDVTGHGYPVLLLAPGGVQSGIDRRPRAAIDPLAELADGLTLIAMDQRHVGRSPAPALPFSYDQSVADQRAVLDAAGVKRAHVVGAGTGCVHALRLLHDAPERISAAVLLEPAGRDGSNSVGLFYRPFHETMRLARAEGLAAVVRAALDNPSFADNPAAGPFARRIHDDPAFRSEVLGMSVERYVALIVRFRDGLWPPGSPLFAVTEEWLTTCETPMLILPGDDACHPPGVADLICRLAPNARPLDADRRSPARPVATRLAIRGFLEEHTPPA